MKTGLVDLSQTDAKQGYEVTCCNCTASIFIEGVTRDIPKKLAEKGWHEAETQDEHFCCVCPRCLEEITENENERGL